MSDYSTYIQTEYRNDLNYSKQFIFSFGSNYSLGVRLFPKGIREATIFFYAFVRYADELVDNPHQKMPGQTHASIDDFISQWKEVVKYGPTKKSHPILRSNYWIFKNREIPFDYSFDFLDVMKQDLYTERYKDYGQLENYMWGSASVVGHIMTFIVGYSNPTAFDHAKALGEAMQLANILRDISEDFTDRNRVYLPQNDMTLFAATESMIAGKKMTPQLFNIIKHYVERTEILFQRGINGIHYLDNGGFSVLLASRIYRENIRILKKRNYDIFRTKIRISKIKKVLMVCTTIILYPSLVLKNKFNIMRNE